MTSKRFQPFDSLTELRLQRGAEYLIQQPARITAGFLHDLAARIGGMPAIVGLLAEYQQRLTPDVIRAAGADRFPPRPLHVVPR